MKQLTMLGKLPTILTAVYLILVALAIIPIFTGGGPLSGVFAGLLTVPWSMLFSGLLPGNLATGLLLVAVGAAINAAIIYFVSRWLVRRLV